ncbi:MAG: XRE family transcriptional regulator [Candidatus Cyclobacteriaceae bacterium M2_1C_046]
MSLISENIRFLRKQANLTQEQFAEKIGIKRSLVGAYEEGRADPRLNNLGTIAELFGTSIDILVNKDVKKLSEAELKTGKFKRGKEILAITVDSEDKENIELVPQKAAAGYLADYSDPEFVAQLPKFRLPFLSTNATYRAFELSGDSMLPLVSGTIIIGEYVDDLRDIKNGKTYILVTKTDGIVYKRVFNYIDDTGKLFLVSDNRQYAPYQVDADDVLELWSSKAYVSVEFPNAEAAQPADNKIEELTKMLMEMQKEIMRLREPS